MLGCGARPPACPPPSPQIEALQGEVAKGAQAAAALREDADAARDAAQAADELWKRRLAALQGELGAARGALAPRDGEIAALKVGGGGRAAAGLGGVMGGGGALGTRGVLAERSRVVTALELCRGGLRRVWG